MKMKIITTMRYNFVPNRLRKMQKLIKTKYWQECGETESLLAGM